MSTPAAPSPPTAASPSSASPSAASSPAASPTFDCQSVARVPTSRPARYGKQLASHMGRKTTASWDEATSTGELQFNREGPVTGVVTLSCQAQTLVMDLRSTAEHLPRLEQVAGIHLARFGCKDQLVVSWVRADGQPGTTQGPLTAAEMAQMRRPRPDSASEPTARQEEPPEPPGSPVAAGGRSQSRSVMRPAGSPTRSMSSSPAPSTTTIPRIPQ